MSSTEDGKEKGTVEDGSQRAVEISAVEKKDPNAGKIPYYLGAHVSAAGGAFHAVENASLLKANAFALFLKSQRQWAMASITEEAIKHFKSNMEKYHFKPEQVLPHGSYLSNIGTSDTALYEKARAAMLEECKRVEQLGLKYLNIHPGSTAKKCTKEESIKHIADAINYIHDHTSYMTIVLENTAGGGGTVGVNFKELKSIIDQVQKKDRIGVCIDTCHAFASGINIASKSGIATMLDNFDETLGLHYLKAMHLNDSTGILGSNRDVHKPLGEGEIGLDAFRQIMNEDRLRGIPLILETPWGDGSYDASNGWAKEIAMLRNLVGVEEVETKKKGIAKMFEKKAGKVKGEKKSEKKDDEKDAKKNVKNDTKKEKREKKPKATKAKKTRKSKSSSESEFTEFSVS